MTISKEDKEWAEGMLAGLAAAIESIAHGDVNGPGGLEGLTMAFSDGVPNNSAIASIGEGLQRVAESLDGIAAAIEKQS